MAKKKTLKEFVEDATKVHGDRYDYSAVNYVDSKTYVSIRCNTCGETFPQTPNNHLRGAGCPHCGRSFGQIIPLKDVISGLKKQWGDIYDFSLIDEENYRGKKQVVQVICQKHGAFPVRLADLCNGHGCPDCAREHLTGRSNSKNKSLVSGVGVNDYDKAVYTNGDVVKNAYKHWHEMITRCYAKDYSKKFQSYKDCSVCDEWLTFSNFLKWFEKNWSVGMEDYHLDKDILVKGNKIYSPHTCCLVPPYVNQMLAKCDARRGNLPIGVYFDKERNRYGAALTKNNKRVQKRFDTIEDAFAFYKREKEHHIKHVAREYYGKGLITEKVYNALMNYKVEITD